MARVLQTGVFLAYWAMASSRALAQDAPDCQIDGPPGTVIFFGNGMNNTRKDARRSLDILMGKLFVDLPDSPIWDAPVYLCLAYNESEDEWLRVLELLEASQMALDDLQVRLWRWVAGLDVLDDDLQAAFQQVAGEVDEEAFLRDDDLMNQVNDMRRVINDGHRVIVVAHSQGNFYANRAYGLVDSPAFKIVAVATPAPDVAGQDDPYTYTTLYADTVIAGIRKALSAVKVQGVSVLKPLLPLEANTPGDVTAALFRDPSGHRFVESYLQGEESGPQILDHIEQALEDACLGSSCCVPGSAASCGKCGTKRCGASGMWEPCSGQGECSAGDVDVQMCNGTGSQEEYCNDDCRWEPRTPCSVPTDADPYFVTEPMLGAAVEIPGTLCFNPTDARDDIGLQTITMMVTGPVVTDYPVSTTVSGTSHSLGSVCFDSGSSAYAGEPGTYWVAIWIKDTAGQAASRVLPVVVTEACDECGPQGTVQCQAGATRTCQNVGGCLLWSGQTSCSSGFCNPGGSACGACDHQCSTVGTSCNGAVLQTCTADSFGCRSLSQQSCPFGCAGGACVGDQPPSFSPAPSLASSVPATDQICFTGTAVDDLGLQTITVKVTGPSVTDFDAMSMSVSGAGVGLGAFCFDAANTAYAGETGTYYVAIWIKDTAGQTDNRVFEVTVTPAITCSDLCAPEGGTACTSGMVSVCETQPDGCLDWGTATVCEDGCASATTCRDCECSTGVCCDGCRFLPSGIVCAADAVVEYLCAGGTDCDTDVYRRTRDRLCAGDSASCNGVLDAFSSPEVSATCGALERCSEVSVSCISCEYCGNATCSAGAGETCDTCPNDCGDCCGNDVCEAAFGEDCSMCETDCGTCCGNGACEPARGEECSTCGSDCGLCCGNLMCEPAFGETCSVCEQDCGGCLFCGNGSCQGGETCLSCPGDCGGCCDPADGSGSLTAGASSNVFAGYRADIVYNGSGYAMVWRDGAPYNINFLRLDLDGQPLGSPVVLPGTAGDLHRIVWTGERYGVTWTEGGQSGSIAFACLSAEGALQGSVQRMAAISPLSASVAWDPGSARFAVVWTDSSLGGVRVRSAMVDDPYCTFSTSPIDVSGSVGQDPDIVFGVGAYLVVWRNDEGSVFYQRLNSSGGKIGDSGLLSLSTSMVDTTTGPQVAWNAAANEFGVVWASRVGGVESVDAVMFGRLTYDGQPVDAPMIVVDENDGLSSGAYMPAIAARGQRYGVVWHHGATQAAQELSDGGGECSPRVTFASGGYLSTIATDGSSYMVVTDSGGFSTKLSNQ